MGQQASQVPAQSISSVPVASQRKKVKAATSDPNFREHEEQWLSQCCCFGTNSLDKWKKLTISDLESLKSDVWPGLLIKKLKQAHIGAADIVYQSDMYCAFKDESEAPSIIRKQSLRSIGSSFGHSRPIHDFNRGQENIVPLGLYEKKGEKRRSGSFGGLSDRDSGQNSAKSFSNKAFGERGLHVLSEIHKPTAQEANNDCLSPFYQASEIPTANKILGTSDPYRQNTDFQGYTPTIKEHDSFVKGHSQQQSLLKYRQITSILKRHLNSQGNIFHVLINEFDKYFMSTYSGVKQRLENKKVTSSEAEQLFFRSGDDITLFISVLYESLNRYYKLDKLRQTPYAELKTIFCRENLIRSLTSIVFNQELHSVSLELYSLHNQKLEETCENHFSLLQEHSVESFGVDEKLTLNNFTLQYLKRKGFLQNGSLHSNHDQTFSFEERKISDAPSPIRLKEGASHLNITNSFVENKTSLDAIFDPYRKAIEKLQTIRAQPSPVYKLEILIKVVRIIQASIRKFYEELGLIYEETLSNNQLLGILYYVLVKSQLSDISTHVQIIKRFALRQNTEATGAEYINILDKIINYVKNKDLQKVDTLENIGLDLQESVGLSIDRPTLTRVQNNTFDNI